jgi:hypothetical protein
MEAFMKKWIVIVFCMILFTGCDKKPEMKPENQSEVQGNNKSQNQMYEEYDTSEWISLTSKDDQFKVTVFINKFTFNENEKIDMFSTVEYLGDKEEIDTWAGRPNFKYIIYDGENYYSEGMQLDVLEKTTFQKGEVYTYPFKKSGGWSEDDESADYWRAYYTDPELRLPAGTYEIRAYCDFSFNDTTPFEEYKQEVKFEITVE